MTAGCYPKVGQTQHRRWTILPSSSLILSVLLVSATHVDGTGEEQPISGPSSNITPFAVVELFTSEFCPACPAAEKLLTEVADAARKKDQQILPLAFHVDYFNRDGAVDPFSDAAFSRRQRTYGAVLGVDDLYTPQMIVNGRAEFIGSNRDTADQQIKAALARPADAFIKLEVDSQPAAPDANHIKIKFHVQGAPSSANLQIAVVERKVQPGTGASQLHDNVVRVFRTVPLANGHAQIADLQLPRSLVRKNASVVAFVQDGRTMLIQGAASRNLATASEADVAPESRHG